MKKTCAIVLRGGVSPIDRQYRSIRKQAAGTIKIDISAIRESIRLNIESQNADWDFTFFIFSWDKDLQASFENLYRPQAHQYIQNSDYRPRIWRLVIRNIANSLLYKPTLFIKKARNPIASLAQDFSGISQAFSISGGADLLASQCAAFGTEFDLVILARPDVVILEPIKLSDYRPDVVTCNAYKDRQGDFRWVFPPRFLGKFKDLPEYFRDRGVHQPHTWIRDYFDSNGVAYEMDRVLAGQGEEVLRKTRGNGIPFSALEGFGLRESEYFAYPK